MKDARAHLVLLSRGQGGGTPTSDADDVDPARSEEDRILAESHRYRLAVVRQARRRMRPPERMDRPDGRRGRTP